MAGIRLDFLMKLTYSFAIVNCYGTSEENSEVRIYNFSHTFLNLYSMNLVDL